MAKKSKNKGKDHNFMGLALLSAVAVIAIIALVLFINSQMTGNAVMNYGSFGVYSPDYVASPGDYAQREYGVKSVVYSERMVEAKAKGAATERASSSGIQTQTTY